jgi:hypothetical protein
MKTLREMMDIIESAQTVEESRRVKGADLQLKLVDRQEDDDTDLDDVVTDYYFDVYRNGQKVGHAQGDSYYGELVVKVDFNREFKLDTYHDKDHPLIQQFEKFQQQDVAEQTTAGEAQEYTVRVVDEEGSGYTVKVTAPSEQGALHKAIVKVRNSGARPEHARIIRQGVAEGWFSKAKPGVDDAGRELMKQDRREHPDMDDYSWQIGWIYADGHNSAKDAYSDAYWNSPTLPSPPEERSFHLGFNARKNQGVAEEQLEETETDPIRRIEELYRDR